MQSSPPPEIMSPEDAAAYLRVPVQDLLTELQNKSIPGLYIAGTWRLHKASLDNLLGLSPNGPQNLSPQNDPAILAPHQAVHVSADEIRGDADAPGSESGNETSKYDTPPAEDLFSKQATSQSAESPSRPENVSEDTSVTIDPLALDPSANAGRLRARVFTFNTIHGDGMARLADNRVVWLNRRSFGNDFPVLFPGDIVELDAAETSKGIEALNVTRIRTPVAPSTSQPASLPASPSHRRTVLPTQIITKKANSREATIAKGGAPLQPKPARTAAQAQNQRPSSVSQRAYERAARAQLEGRYDEARRFFRQAIEAGAPPSAFEVYIKMEERLGNRNTVQELIPIALDRFPEHANFYDMHGRMELRRRQYAEAQQIFRKGLNAHPRHPNLLWGLAQTLVQEGSETSFREAAEIFDRLGRLGRLPKDHQLYQRFRALQKNSRANQAYDFFLGASSRVGIPSQRGNPSHFTDMVVELSNTELVESYALTGAFLLRCYKHHPAHIDILNLSRYLRSLGPQGVVGLQDGREAVLNTSLAFIAVPDVEAIRDQVMSVLSEGFEAIVPVDDKLFSEPTEQFRLLKELLSQYLGMRDLYSSTLPVSGVRRFFGRELVLRRLSDQIHSGQFIGIYGLRKMGKTSLIYELRDKILGDEAVAYVDLQANAALMTKEFGPVYWELERSLHRRLLERQPKIAELLRLGKFTRYEDIPDRDRIGLMFSDDMRELLDAIRDGNAIGIKRVVIVLDELERLLPVGGQPGIDGYIEFFGLLRGLAQNDLYHGLLSCVVVAANAAISEKGYWEGRENPVFAFFKPELLPPFSETETEEMIRTLGKGMSVYWDDDALREIYIEINGHPFLTRLLCSRIGRKNPTRPLQVSKEMVQREVLPFLREEGDKMEQIVELLRANFPEEEVILEQIALDEIPSELPDDQLRHLTGYHLVSTETGRPHITLNLLRRWLRRRAGLTE